MAGTAIWEKNNASVTPSPIETITALAGNESKLTIKFTQEAFPDHYLYYTCHIRSDGERISSDKFDIELLRKS